MKYNFLIIIVFTFFTGWQVSVAQLPDASVASGFYNILKENLDKETAEPFDSSKISVDATLTLYFHVINDIMGLNGIDEDLINESVNYTNFVFSEIGLKFKIGVIDTVKEYPYGTVINNDTDVELMLKYEKKKCINIFLVDSIFIGDMNYYGLTWFPDDTVRNAIFLRKDVMEAVPLITMLGHFFGLLSTYDKYLGKEYVDGSNCRKTGDLICDTYADPDIIGKVNGECKYNDGKQDPNGKFYVPSVANFMTSGPFECKCIFTPEQYRRMHFYYKNYRSYLR